MKIEIDGTLSNDPKPIVAIDLLSCMLCPCLLKIPRFVRFRVKVDYENKVQDARSARDESPQFSLGFFWDSVRA
jgi:hypothetical protein